MKQTELLQRLRALDVRRDASAPAEFESILAEIARSMDAEIIEPLLHFFEDSAPQEDLMFSLLHTIESFSDRVYIQHLLRGTEALLRRSPRWAEIIYLRVLNSDDARSELATQVRRCDDVTQRAVGAVLARLCARRPQFLEKARLILGCLL